MKAEHEKAINSAVFPGLQGGPLMHVIAAKAVAFKEALDPSFKVYQQQVLKNADIVAKTLTERGLRIVSGGTQSHVMLVDLRAKGITGKAAEAALGNAHMTINPALIKNIPYDSKADFAPVAILYNTTFFIATSVNGPYKSLSQLISFAKANPGRVFYGSPYVGSPSHLGGAYLESLTGTKMVHVPFKDVLQIYTTVATGQVDWALGSYGSMAALVQAGKLKLMAVAGKKRLLSQPDVPTANELLGLKDYEVNSWVAFIAPKNVPDSVVRKINADVNRVLESAETKQTLNQLGFIGAADSVEGLARIIDTDLKINFDLVRKSGITAE
jgi:tripartite-type tricarboxylate transporter receptor subunit TctC